jgi:hypothetical protein
LLSSKE